MNDLTHLSLFSGIGGLDLAAEWAGFRTVGKCEWADYPRAVLEKHWPGMPRWRDIRTLTGDDFYAKTGLRTVDVISGGFPCQPFSTAGKRRGKEDDRYLWPEMLRVISEILPSWIVGENVAGLVSMVESNQKFRVESRTINRLPDQDHYEAVLSRQEDALLVQIIEDIERIGYEVQAFVIPACAVGAPHRRDRVAIVDRNSNWDSEHPERQICKRKNTESGRICKDVSNSDKVRRRVRGPEREGVRRSELPFHETDSGGEDVSNSGEIGLQAERPEQQAEGVTGGCENVGDSDCKGLQGSKQYGISFDREPHCTAREYGDAISDTHNRCWDVRGNRQLSATKDPGTEWCDLPRGAPGHGGGEWWSAEPNVGRVANGVPARVDRLKCLGNAVVPKQFYPIFRAIAEVERYG